MVLTFTVAHINMTVNSIIPAVHTNEKACGSKQ